MLSKASVIFKVGPQPLTAQFTIEAELLAAALAMKGVLFCSKTTIELGFGKKASAVPIYIDDAATLHATGNRTYSGGTKHATLR